MLGQSLAEDAPMLPFIAIVLVTWFLIATFPIWFGLTMDCSVWLWASSAQFWV